MEDLSFIKFKRLRKNKSEEDQKILHKKTLLDKKQSVETCPAEVGSSRQSYLDHSSLPSSLPSSPPAYHSVPFSARRLGDWARAKRLEEILTMFPADMSLLEFSHLTLTTPAVLSGSDPIIINNHMVVTDSRLKEKVMVAISAARAARRQVEAEVEHNMPCTSPIISPNRRSLDSEGLSLFHHSRFGSAAQRLSREVNIHQSTRSLNTTQDNITSGKIAVSFDQSITAWSDPSPY